MDRIELDSFAKVNLTLEVGAKRPDGYHEIDSVVSVIDIRDRLSIEKAEPGLIEVDVEGDAPQGRDNLIYRACEAFLRETEISGGARFGLEKRIPMQAGLGGGSGNAAAAIVGLDRLYETQLPQDELCALAASVGSDAGLFVHGGTVRMHGRGEQVEPLPDAPCLDLVVVMPGFGVSTAWAYEELDRAPSRKWLGASDRAESAIRQGDREALIESLWNDFDRLVRAFEGMRMARWLLNGARTMLCGSGSALFGVFDSPESAKGVAGEMMRSYRIVFATRMLSRAESSGEQSLQ